MKKLDKDVVYKHLKDMDEALEYLRDKKKLTKIQIMENIELRFAIERALHIAIQNLIDIGSHILASLNMNEVETYTDVPKRLTTAKIIPISLSNNLVNMAKFRNILVHEYIKIETEKLVSFLKHNLSDFDDFAKAIIKHIEG